MPRRAAGLSAVKVRTAKPGRYGDGKGLYLLVRSAESRFWLFRYRPHDGRMREMGLGSVADVSLAEAREKAENLYRTVKAGKDPLAEREARLLAERAAKQQAAIRALTFGEVADQYVAAHEASWRNDKHKQQWRNTLKTYAAPILGTLPVAAVDVGAVMRVLEPIWRAKPETASRLRGRIESVLDYATARGWRSGENPARWRGHIETMLPARTKVAGVEHHAALPWQQMGEFWSDLTNQEGVSTLALKFAILTAARTSEALGARWSEVDMKAKMWTVPPTRMKAGREHRVPLSDEALVVVADAWKRRPDNAPDDAFVFPGAQKGKALSNMAMLMLLRRMGRGDLTAHGFRSTFRDWTSEATGHPREVAEAALAHTNKDKVEAAYQRGDLIEKRRRLMTDWANFCIRPVAKSDGTVVMFSPGRASA